MIPLRPILISALALTAIGLGALAYSEHAARVSAEELARSLQIKLDKIAQTPPPAVQLVPVMPPTHSPEGLVTPDDATAAPVTGRAGNFPGPLRSPADFISLLDSPEVQQLMSLRGRGALDSRYAALFKGLGLPPDQLQKFQQLLLDKQSTVRDVLSAMRSQGLMPSRENAEQMRTLVQNANAEIDSQIQSALGPAAYAQYQAYEETQPQRATVERVQQRLSYSREPLSDQQAASLVNILAQTAPASPEATGPRRRFQPGNDLAPISGQAVEQAKAVLSPGQVAALQELQEEQQAQAQLGRRARENITGARPTSPPGN